MRHFSSVIFIDAFLAFSQVAVASPAAYTCKVIHVYTLGEGAVLKPSGFEKGMKGSTFSVSRATGKIVGEVVTTLMASSVRVVNAGSSENSFKVVAFFDGQVQVLEVQEFKPGPIKPFVALSMGGAGIVTGFCK